MYTLGFILLPLYLVITINLQAQTCCTAGAPIASVLDVGSTVDQPLMIALSYEYNSVNRLVDQNSILENDPRTRSGQAWMVHFNYTINNKWAVSAILPWIQQGRNTLSEQETVSAFGDLILLGQYTPWSKKERKITIGLGMKLPSGVQNTRSDRNIVLSPDMQSGSGTSDFIGRFSFHQSHLFTQNLHFQTALNYRLNTTNAHFGDPDRINGRRFKFGNETTWTNMISYQTVVHTSFVTPEMGVQFRYTQANQEQGLAANNSGGFWLNYLMGIQLLFKENYLVRLSSTLPIWQDLEGLQITTDYRIGAQLRYLF